MFAGASGGASLLRSSLTGMDAVNEHVDLLDEHVFAYRPVGGVGEEKINHVLVLFGLLHKHTPSVVDAVVVLVRLVPLERYPSSRRAVIAYISGFAHGPIDRALE